MDAAMEILNDMETKNVTPNAAIYGSLIVGYQKMGDVASVNDVKKEMKERGIMHVKAPHNVNAGAKKKVEEDNKYVKRKEKKEKERKGRRERNKKEKEEKEEKE